MKDDDKLIDIKGYVERYSGISLEKNRRRLHEVFARSVYYKLSRELTSAPYNDIGKAVGRNHATVMHGIKVFPDAVKLGKFDRIYNGYKMGVPPDEYIEKKIKEDQEGNKVVLEPHELKYRDLPEEKKEIFKVRVEAILKML